MPVIANVIDVVPVSPYGVCYAPAEQRHIPYSYGNPLINLGANALLRAVEPYVDEDLLYGETA